MRVLAVDTSLGACSAAVLDGEAVRARLCEPMDRGHQERLAPLAAEAMAGAGLAFDALDRVAVTTGPGSFTGLRVGLAFAKGLALALDRPLLGIGTLEALAAGALGDVPAGGVVAAVLDARRGRVHLQAFRDGRPLDAPACVDLEAALAFAAAWAGAGPLRLVGPGAALLAPAAPGAGVEAALACDPAVLARLAAGRDPADAPPVPLYLRGADALTLAERRAAAAAATAA